MRRLVFFAFLVVGALAQSACKGPCRQLSEQLCNCALTTADHDACMQNASNEDARIGPTAEDNARCQPLLNECDCHLTNTPQGKVTCGLARPPAVPDAGADAGA